MKLSPQSKRAERGGRRERRQSHMVVFFAAHGAVATPRVFTATFRRAVIFALCAVVVAMLPESAIVLFSAVASRVAR